MNFRIASLASGPVKNTVTFILSFKKFTLHHTNTRMVFSVLRVSHMRQMMHKWQEFSTTVTLPMSGHPAKITPRARQTILQEVTKNPKVTSKELQEDLASCKSPPPG